MRKILTIDLRWNLLSGEFHEEHEAMIEESVVGSVYDALTDDDSPRYSSEGYILFTKGEARYQYNWTLKSEAVEDE